MHTIGEISLTVSFVLYMFLYLPQSIRNFRHQRLSDMSLGFHALLMIASTADLYYGFGRIVQWQYRVVSLVMFLLLLVQHIQLLYHHKQFQHGLAQLIALSMLVIVMLIFLIPTLNHPAKWIFLFVSMGWIERLSDWLYGLPQFIKNKRSGRADIISPLFLSLGILCTLCDVISAWCLNWGPSSLYGAPLSLLFKVALLTQWNRCRQTTLHPQLATT